MTQQEVLEYNKRCAEFLGKEITNSLVETQMDLIGSNELKFHSDWNWIMEVVDAIVEKTKFKTIDECSEEEWYATIGITRLTITSKKEAVVQAINQFLIYYNNENNNNRQS